MTRVEREQRTTAVTRVERKQSRTAVTRVEQIPSRLSLRLELPCIAGISRRASETPDPLGAQRRAQQLAALTIIFRSTSGESSLASCLSLAALAGGFFGASSVLPSAPSEVGVDRPTGLGGGGMERRRLTGDGDRSSSILVICVSGSVQSTGMRGLLGLSYLSVPDATPRTACRVF